MSEHAWVCVTIIFVAFALLGALAIHEGQSTKRMTIEAEAYLCGVTQ